MPNFMQVKPPESRGKFNVDKFAEHYKLGSPVAIFYFLAEYEDATAANPLVTLARWLGI